VPVVEEAGGGGGGGRWRPLVGVSREAEATELTPKYQGVVEPEWGYGV
jgi:hypothetical protein